MVQQLKLKTITTFTYLHTINLAIDLSGGIPAMRISTFGSIRCIAELISVLSTTSSGRFNSTSLICQTLQPSTVPYSVVNTTDTYHNTWHPAFNGEYWYLSKSENYVSWRRYWSCWQYLIKVFMYKMFEGIWIKQSCIGKSTVPSSTSYFLDKGLDVVWWPTVIDVADIGRVYSHPKYHYQWTFTSPILIIGSNVCLKDSNCDTQRMTLVLSGDTVTTWIQVHDTFQSAFHVWKS